MNGIVNPALFDFHKHHLHTISMDSLKLRSKGANPSILPLTEKCDATRLQTLHISSNEWGWMDCLLHPALWQNLRKLHFETDEDSSDLAIDPLEFEFEAPLLEWLSVYRNEPDPAHDDVRSSSPPPPMAAFIRHEANDFFIPSNNFVIH